MNVLVPMAGRGSRFAEAGYTFPKPLIDVRGEPMIAAAVRSLGVVADRFIYLVLAEHLREYAIREVLHDLTPTAVVTVVPVQTVTQGAACTALLARNFIDNDEPLLIANSDQVIDWDGRIDDSDGMVLTFPASHPKWSYVRLDGYRVREVAEKRPISHHATCGVYWFKRGRDFVRAADRMIAANKRVNGEFYIAPAINELIADGKRITAHPVHAMHGLGTPEDLEAYLRSAA